MSATISQIASGLKTRLETISGLRGFSYQPEQENPPFGFPQLNGVDYHHAFRGGDVVTNWTVTVVVGRWLDRTANASLTTIFHILVLRVLGRLLRQMKHLVAYVQLL